MTVRNRLGLHARPAALLVRTLAPLDARVTLAVPARGRGPADARSLTAVGGLGVRCGDQVLVSATGAQAAEALDDVRRLADEGFGEPDDLVEPPDGLPGGEAADGAPALDAAAGAPALGPPPAGAVLTGVPAAPGLALGPARLLRRTPVPAVWVASGDPDAEWRALEAARAAVAEDLRRAREAMEDRAGAAETAIFDAHLLLVDDPGLLEPARRGGVRPREPAGRAWADAVARAAAVWDALDEPYQRARAADVRDVGDQVLRRLTSGGAQESSGTRSESGGQGRDAHTTGAPAVFVTDELTPADVAGFAPGAVAGVACARGGPTAHAVILARALGVPVVVGAGDLLLAVEDGTPLLVDGDEGTVTVRPPDEELAAVEERRRARRARGRRRRPPRRRTGRHPRRRDDRRGGQRRRRGEAAAAVAGGADGVGLLRTEFLFLDAAELPDEDEQAAAYEAVAAALQRPAAHHPHARRRRRQAASCAALGAGAEPLPRRPRPAPEPAASRAAALPAARGPAHGGRAPGARDVPDGGGGGRAAAGARGCWTRRAPSSSRAASRCRSASRSA